MIIDISDSTFKDILNDEKLFLPIRWDGADFSFTLNNLFNHYIKSLTCSISDKKYIKDIRKVCNLLKKSVDYYLNGFPSQAYSIFKQAMKILMINPLKIYEKKHYGTI